mgnify:CR=1 FL=1
MGGGSPFQVHCQWYLNISSQLCFPIYLHCPILSSPYTIILHTPNVPKISEDSNLDYQSGLHNLFILLAFDGYD